MEIIVSLSPPPLGPPTLFHTSRSRALSSASARSAASFVLIWFLRLLREQMRSSLETWVCDLLTAHRGCSITCVCMCVCVSVPLLLSSVALLTLRFRQLSPLFSFSVLLLILDLVVAQFFRENVKSTQTPSAGFPVFLFSTPRSLVEHKHDSAMHFAATPLVANGEPRPTATHERAERKSCPRVEDGLANGKAAKKETADGSRSAEPPTCPFFSCLTSCTTLRNEDYARRIALLLVCDLSLLSLSFLCVHVCVYVCFVLWLQCVCILTRIAP